MNPVKARILKWLAIPFSSGPHFSEATKHLKNISMVYLLSMPSAVSVFIAFIFHVGGFPQIAVNLHYTFLFKSKAL